MKNFSQLNIKQASGTLVGDKIKISKILNRECIIHAFKIEVSKYPKNKSGKCLYLQIEIENVKHVVFTGSDVLINTITQVPAEEFPFVATIVKEGEHFEFR